MTGGLWRLTGQQVAAAAASLGTAVDTPTGQAAGGGAGGAGGASGTSAGAGGGAGGSAAQGGGAEKVQGPHAALAVKLAQRDPGRPFLLGERIQYVLLAGAITLMGHNSIRSNRVLARGITFAAVQGTDIRITQK